MDQHHSHYRDRDQDHRPPVLFQSDDLDHDIAHPLHRGHNLDHSTHHPSTRHHSSTHDKLRHDGSSLYPGEDERPVHVHSQACHDSCPVQDVYTEISYSRFSSGARTNLYGLVVVKELGTPSTYPSPGPVPTENLFAIDSMVDASSLVEASSSTAERNTSRTRSFSASPAPQAEDSSSHEGKDNEAEEKTIPTVAGTRPGSGAEIRPEDAPSTKSSIFTPSGSSTWAHLPGRYVLVAAGSSIKCIMGLQESFEFVVHGLDQGGETTGSANQEIVSIDAFERKDERGCQLVVLVSIAKAVDPPQFELRCYGAKTFGKSIKELLLKLPISRDVQSIPLTWAPTKIIHSPLEDDPFEMAILVGGSDSCVHFFVQDSSNGVYEEQPIDTHFSVLASFSYCEYCVLSLEIKDYPNCRVVAAGTQNGTLNIGIIPRDPTTFKLDRSKARSHTIVLFAPITTLTVFTSRVQADLKNRLQEDLSEAETEKVGAHNEEPGIHLLVTCAIEQAWVYSNINKYGLANRSDLSECSYHDSIMAAHVMDADWDGKNEIMIGTYGRQLMVFKELALSQTQASNGTMHNGVQSRPTSITAAGTKISISPASFPPHPQLISHHAQFSTASASGPTPLPPPALQWGMTWNRRFASPVYGISSVDLNDDGLEELVITTLNGCSIFLPDPLTAKRRLGQAVDRMRAIEEMKATLARLRQENDELLKEKEEKEAREAQEIKAANEAKEAREAALVKAAKEEEEREEKRRAALAAEKKAQEEAEKERARKEAEEFRIRKEQETLAREQEEQETLARGQEEEERTGVQTRENEEEGDEGNGEPGPIKSITAMSSEDPDLTTTDAEAEVKAKTEGENTPQDPDQGGRGKMGQEQSDEKVLEAAESANAHPATEENEEVKGEDADEGQLKGEETEKPDLEGGSKLRRSNESEFDGSPEIRLIGRTRQEQDRERDIGEDKEEHPTLP